MLENKEIRNLKEGTLYNVIQILDINDDWKRFMSLIPMDPQKTNSELKYNNEHIRLIEDYAKDTREKCAKILFDEWGTSGQIRPTLRTIQEIALKADMMRVADEIARLLGEDPPPRPQLGPGAPVLEDLSVLLTSSEIRDTTKRMGSESNETANHNQAQIDSTRQYNLPNFNMLIQSSGSSDNRQSNQSSANKSLPSHGQSSQGSNRILGQHTNSTEPSHQSPDNNSFNNQQPGSYQEYNDQLPSYEPSQFQESVPDLSIFQSKPEKPLGSRIDSAIMQDTNLIQFDYNELHNMTCNFSDSYKTGSGGFGEVFKAMHPVHGQLAIKKSNLKVQEEMAFKTFNLEVKFLSRFRHENIVPILGVALNGPIPCIVCEFIEGGSLFEKIGKKVLSERQRFRIMRGTAEGLRYLHSNSAPVPAHAADPSELNFAHGDVKSDNILLTKDFVPKLCDFGLAKQLDKATCMASKILGTQFYMAPEAITGTVTQKGDIYGYGIVLLELLTGRRPIVTVGKETIHLKTYIYDGIKRENKTISDFLDQSAEWTLADEMFALAQQCLEPDRHDRPSSEQICDKLRALDPK